VFVVDIWVKRNDIAPKNVYRKGWHIHRMRLRASNTVTFIVCYGIQPCTLVIEDSVEDLGSSVGVMS
jgi:hypothetical protein